MKNCKILCLTFLCVFLLSGYSFAAYINARPVSPLGDNGFEDTLQEVFDSITISGGIDAVNDQIANAIFDNTASGVSTATFIIEISAYSGTNEFGLYEYSDPSNKALIFEGGDGAGDQVSVTFNSDGTIGVTQLWAGGIYTQAATDFTGAFGFYIDVYGTDSVLDNTFYSEDDRNPGLKPQALIYQGDDETGSRV